MGVRKWGLGWDVGHDVVVVDYSVALGELGLDVLSQELVADSGFAESVVLVHVTESALDVESSDCRQG